MISTQLAHFLDTGTIDAILSPNGDILGLYQAEFSIRSYKEGNFIVGSLEPISEFATHETKSPRIELFSPTDTPYARITWSNILGSDLLPGGIKGIGPSILQNKQARFDGNPHLVIAQFNEIQQAALNRAIEAARYEPVFLDLSSESIGYLQGMTPPATLFSCNQHFLLDPMVTTIIDSPSLICATGHQLPLVYSPSTCSQCCRIFCELCVYIPSKSNDPFKCIECRFDLHDVSDEAESSSVELTQDDIPTESEMTSIWDPLSPLQYLFQFDL